MSGCCSVEGGGGTLAGSSRSVRMDGTVDSIDVYTQCGDSGWALVGIWIGKGRKQLIHMYTKQFTTLENREWAYTFQ